MGRAMAKKRAEHVCCSILLCRLQCVLQRRLRGRWPRSRTDSFTCATLLIHMCAKTNSYLRHVFFTTDGDEAGNGAIKHATSHTRTHALAHYHTHAHRFLGAVANGHGTGFSCPLHPPPVQGLHPWLPHHPYSSPIPGNDLLPQAPARCLVCVDLRVYAQVVEE